MYKKYLKRFIDLILAIAGAVMLAIPMLVIALAIYMDDPGPVLFKQRRIGKNSAIFSCYKFRSMKMSTPHDVPTHMLIDPEQYITRVGRFIRKMSIDELPQIFNIIKGDMAIVGPRPALWNQEDLADERDRYGANDVRPGLTGWAQINGRDELEIRIKARLDGEYVEILNRGGWKAFSMDCRCFFGTFLAVLLHDGVVEGGTGNFVGSGVMREMSSAKVNSSNKIGGGVTICNVRSVFPLSRSDFDSRWKNWQERINCGSKLLLLGNK